MEKIKPILSLVLRILFALVLVTTTILSVSTAYIVFAPDDFPKPFYLVYAYPESGVPPTYTIAKPTKPAEETSSEHSTDNGHETGSEAVVEGNYLPGQGIMYDTGNKIINLADEGGKKYISITISLEFAPDDPAAYEEYLKSTGHSTSGGSSNMPPLVSSSSGEGTTGPDYVTAFIERVNQKKPIIDDIITTVVSSHKYADIYTMEGKEALKKEIAERINQSLPGFHVIAVYFTNFVIEG